MPQFYKASITDFDELLNLVMEFEFDKDTLYDNEDKINKAKMLKENRKHLKKYLKDETYHYIVCKKGTELIAYIFMSYGDVYQGEGYINEVFVIPAERKKGIAKKLIEKSIAWLKLHNCSKIDITVNRKNKNALELYKKYGFAKFEDNYISMRKNI